jgi:nucleoid DNA-binding protein
MTRTEFIDALATEANMDKRDAKRFLEAVTSVIERTIKAGGEIPLKGLGKFKVQNRKARVGRNPLTGDPVDIPAKTVVKFTVAKALKDLIN